MAFYCPRCWAEMSERMVSCPRCGGSMDRPGLDLVDKMIGALRHPEPTRAGLAVYVLTEMLHEPRSVEPLIALVQARPDLAVLCAAAAGLGRLGDARAVPALAALLDDEAVGLPARVAAVHALARIGGAAAHQALERARHSDWGSIRGAAAAAVPGTQEDGAKAPGTR